MTTSQRQAATKAMWSAQYQARIGTEALIIASIVGGMSRRALADQLSMSESNVRRIWNKHVAEWDNDDALRAELQTRCRTQVRALWTRAIDPKTSVKEAAALNREIRQLTHEQALLGNLLHVQVDASVSGSVEVTERREVRVTVVREKLAGLRQVQMDRPALPPAPESNGHGPAAHNGSEAA